MKHRGPIVLVVPFGALVGSTALANQGGRAAPQIWLALAAVLLAAKLGGEVALRAKQPAVLGELLVGVVLGNLQLVGVGFFTEVLGTPAAVFLAELGVVLLLFQAGLESTVSQMRAVAAQCGLVASVGVVAPMALGVAAIWLMMPETTIAHHLFVGATLCSTSIGITARVMSEIGAMQRPETPIILGAAVLDDVLGLVVLSVISAVAVSGSLPGVASLLWTVGSTLGFLTLAIAVGVYLTPGVFRAASRLRATGVLEAAAVGLCLLFAGAAEMVGLAPIVGAFAAGLVLDDVNVKPFGHAHVAELEKLVAPIVATFSPVFFVRTGMAVDLSAISARGLLVAAVLTVAAILGKVVAGFAARGRSADRLAIGIGMIPRGEVGLVFADAGARLLERGKPVLDSLTYTIVLLMVIVTTVVTPPWLTRRLQLTAGVGGPGDRARSAQ